jgi:hypothetical protein
MERHHSTIDKPTVRNILPQPEVIKSAGDPASTSVDIDFKVFVPDIATT